MHFTLATSKVNVIYQIHVVVTSESSEGSEFKPGSRFTIEKGTIWAAKLRRRGGSCANFKVFFQQIVLMKAYICKDPIQSRSNRCCLLSFKAREAYMTLD